MHSISVAQAKAQLSALLDAVERGEAVEITRRGVAVARLVRAPQEPSDGFDLSSFLASTTDQPLHAGGDAAALMRELREGARF